MWGRGQVLVAAGVLHRTEIIARNGKPKLTSVRYAWDVLASRYLATWFEVSTTSRLAGESVTLWRSWETHQRFGNCSVYSRATTATERDVDKTAVVCRRSSAVADANTSNMLTQIHTEMKRGEHLYHTLQVFFVDMRALVSFRTKAAAHVLNRLLGAVCLSVCVKPTLAFIFCPSEL